MIKKKYKFRTIYWGTAHAVKKELEAESGKPHKVVKVIRKRQQLNSFGKMCKWRESIFYVYRRGD